jgi:hypothetical protein
MRTLSHIIKREDSKTVFLAKYLKKQNREENRHTRCVKLKPHNKRVRERQVEDTASLTLRIKPAEFVYFYQGGKVCI